jgi:hypothetical protein
MPLVVFKRAWDVGVLENIEHPIIRENVVACELVIGRNTPLGLSKASRGAFQVAQISIFIWFDGLKRLRPTQGAANAPRRQPRLDVAR